MIRHCLINETQVLDVRFRVQISILKWYVSFIWFVVIISACGFCPAAQERDASARVSASVARLSLGEKLTQALAMVVDFRSLPSAAWRAVACARAALSWSLHTSGLATHASRCNRTQAADEWRKSHLGIEAGLLPALPVPSSTVHRRQRRLCWEAGMCICSGRGLKVRQIVTRYEKHFKAVFAGQEPHLERSLALNGFIVLKLSFSRPAGPQHDDGEEEGMEQQGPLVTHGYFHIALQYLAPFRSTFLELEPCTRLDQQHDGGVLLQPRCDAAGSGVLDEHRPFLTCFEVISDLDLRQRWHIQFMRLCDGSRLLMRPFIPGIVEAVHVQDSDACLWKGSAHERSVKRRRRRVAKADGSGSGSDGHGAADGVAGQARPASDEDDAAFEDDSESGREGSGTAGGDVGMLDALLTMGDADDAASSGPDSSSSEISSCSGGSVHESDLQSIASSELERAWLPDTDFDIDSSSDEADVGGRSPGMPEAHQDAMEDAGDQVRAAPLHAAGHEGLHVHSAQAGLSVFRGHVVHTRAALKYNRTNDEFYAVCPRADHGRCILTRSAHAGRTAAQGRPLGLLAAWVLAADDCETKEAHKRRTPTKEQRLAARRDLVQGGQEGLAQEFFGLERPQRDGEDSEPDRAP
jgi:hypothetical protein